jgi:hypothetical protein
MQIEALEISTGIDAVPEMQPLDGGVVVGAVGGTMVVGGADGVTVVGVDVWGNEPVDGVVVLVEPAVSGLTQFAGGLDVPA